MPSYNPAAVEKRWQAYWETNETFRTPDPGEPGVAGKPKCYVLDMFPYPSGAGLHVGHPEGYTATDIYSRFKRMKGFNVLHPMGWDAFGLPAEEYARKHNVHPRKTTADNINTFRRQIKSLGFSYDWDRELDTTDPNYFRWTQWIFLLIYDTWYDPVMQKGRPISELPIPDDVKKLGDAAVRKYRNDHRLAYQAEATVNWCPAMGTVLSNEEVVDGKSDVGGHPVERRPLRQWLMRITAYAERLLSDLEPLEWSHSIKEMQRNWIGKSEGAEVDFVVESKFSADDDPPPNIHHVYTIRVFTTRPDTLFGATYMVLSPEHPLVRKITTKEQKEAVKAYQEAASRKSDFERTELAKTKTGVFTGAYAINPVNSKPIPVWIADYVLASYGTGAIMAVPGHDDRDFEFAINFRLPIVAVVKPSLDWLSKNGDHLEAMVNAEGKQLVWNYWELVNVAEKEGNSFESQTYDIYVRQVSDFKTAFTELGTAINSSNGEITLDGLPTADAKRKITTWLEAKGLGKKTTNYKLRDWLFSRQRYWGEPFPVLHAPDGSVVPLSPKDLPVTLPEMEDFKPTGSPEGPLAKATQWVNVTIDAKPYKRETNTMPQWAGSCWYYLRYIDPRNAEAFADPKKLAHWLPVDLYIGGAEHAVLHLLYARFWHKVLMDRGYVPCPEPFQRLVNQGMILGENNEKMSKSRGNVVTPDEVIAEFGADSMRLYEMFMGPLEAVKPWQMNGVVGVYRFLGKVWRLIVDDFTETMQLNPAVKEIEPDKETLRELHRTIQKVTEDTDGLRFNTAISSMMEFCNHLTKQETRSKAVLETFVKLLAPYAPHVAEELWATLGHSTTLAYESWPTFDPKLTVADTIEIPVQVNGKLRARLTVPSGLDAAGLEAAAKGDETIRAQIAGKTVKKVIVVPGKLVNLVVV